MKKYRQKPTTKQRGFTIVELLISMAVFQVILIMTLVAYMQMSRYYQKTINANRLQQVGNGVVDDIARSIQNTGGMVAGTSYLTAIDVNAVGGAKDKTATKQIQKTVMTPSGSSFAFNVLCVDNTRYLYRFDANEKGGTFPGNYNNHVFMSDTVASPSVCPSAAFPQTNPRLILSEDMRVYGFGVTQQAANSASYLVNINLAFTSDPNDIDQTMFTPPGPASPGSGFLACNGGAARQFCATSNISTTVVRRIGL